jgi:hypothetical protein
VADEHRRVEANSIIGSGMSTDPEKIREVEDEHERVMRQRREKPKRGFNDVLAEAPARASHEDDDEDADAEGRTDEPTAGDDSEDDAAASSAPAPVDLDAPAPELPRAPVDPRMKQLHAMLQGSSKAKK